MWFYYLGNEHCSRSENEVGAKYCADSTWEAECPVWRTGNDDCEEQGSATSEKRAESYGKSKQTVNCLLNKWIITKKPDDGNAVYDEDYGYVEEDACHKHRYETKHGGDWFKVHVILVVKLS